MKAKCLLFLALLLIFGCGKPQLDGSSTTAMSESMEKVCDSLSEKEAKVFALVYTQLVLKMGFEGKTEKQMLAVFNGKTVDDVYEMAGKEVVDAIRKQEE